ncbi:MAG: phosphonate ABC transporter ATP-binding protein [Alphaproteobacteria bacterium]|nr:phosphonate ABC transporter ATP-binding protein [Alphaproteobacteria bacterium]
MAAISVNGLTKTFGKSNKALNGVDFEIGHGEMVALIGASGSGKSTLIRLIAGLIEADRKSGPCCIDVLGQTVQSGGRVDRAASRVRPDIGVIFQQFNLVDRLSVLSNVMVGTLGRISRWRGYFGIFTRAERLMAMQALDRVGIAPTARQRASTLSGGQQQRAAIARALVQQSKVMLADEPIASLDPASSKRVMETLKTINEEDGITVVVSLHQVDYAVRYCPRTIALRDGQKIYDGPSSALTPEFLHELYGSSSDELILGSATSVSGAGKTRDRDDDHEAARAARPPARTPELAVATA